MVSMADELVSDEPETNATGKPWGFDRKVSLSLLLVVAMNLAGGIWYAAKLDSRVGSLEDWTKENRGVEHRLTSVETKLDILIDQRKAASR